MTNKKRNSQKDPGFVKLSREELVKLLGTVIYDPETNSLNGVPLEVIETRLAAMPKLPDGYIGTCFICKPPIHFKDSKSMMQHELDRHRVWKG